MTGNREFQSHFLEELLSLILQQKRLILSNRNVLPSFFTSLLGSSCHSLLVPENIGQRFTIISSYVISVLFIFVSCFYLLMKIVFSLAVVISLIYLNLYLENHIYLMD